MPSISNYYISNNYIGAFYVDEMEFHGELIYNRDTGKITLNLKKELYLNMEESSDPDSYTCKELGKEYNRIDAISGKLAEGNAVVLFNCRCIYSAIVGTRVGHARVLQFQAEYIVWNDPDAIGRKYSKLVFILENALRWSQLTQLDCTKTDIVTFNPIKDCPRFSWFGSTITFGTYLTHDTTSVFKEKTQIIERLAIAIQVEEDKDIRYFLDVRNKIMAMISYGIKDNLNVVRQYLSQNDAIVKYPEGTFGKNFVEHWEYDLLTNEPYHIVEEKFESDYNFTLKQLSKDSGLAKKLEDLTPVFNLYLSLFKYQDMPIEMVFLNVIQAFETFHARFFFGDDDGAQFQKAIGKKYNYTEPPISEYMVHGVYIPDYIFDGQFDPERKKSKVKLFQRVRHMLIIPDNQLLWEFCKSDDSVAQLIVDTRNYYTHYNDKKEGRAARGKDLEILTEFVAFVLEYHIHDQLGIELGKTPIILENDESQADYSDYAQYMRKLIKNRDYFASVLLTDSFSE